MRINFFLLFLIAALTREMYVDVAVQIAHWNEYEYRRNGCSSRRQRGGVVVYLKSVAVCVMYVT